MSGMFSPEWHYKRRAELMAAGIRPVKGVICPTCLKRLVVRDAPSTLYSEKYCKCGAETTSRAEIEDAHGVSILPVKRGLSISEGGLWHEAITMSPPVAEVTE